MATTADPVFSRKAAALMHSPHVLALPADQFLALRDALDAATSEENLPPHIRALFSEEMHASIVESEFRPELHPRGRSGEWIETGMHVRLRGGPRKWKVTGREGGYVKISHGQAFDRVQKTVVPRDLTPWDKPSEEKADPGVPPKMTKVAVGWYASPDGVWALIGDNPGDVHTKAEADGSGLGTGGATQREWQVVHDPSGGLRASHNAGSTMGWSDSKREAQEEFERRWRAAQDKADPGTPSNPREAAIFQPGVFKGIFHGFTHGQMRATVTDEWGDGTGVSGAIYTVNGDEVGTFAREVAVDNGEVRVHHDSLMLQPEARGQGFGTAFFEHSMAEYEKLGVDRVTVKAADLVGGYQWARMGFDFDWNRAMLFMASPVGMTHLWGDEKAARAYAASEMWQTRGLLTPFYAQRTYGSMPPEVFDEFVERFPTPDKLKAYADGDAHALDGTWQSPSEIATFGREHTWVESHDPLMEGVTMWLGKRFLLGSAWRGEIRLTPRPEAPE